MIKYITTYFKTGHLNNKELESLLTNFYELSNNDLKIIVLFFFENDIQAVYHNHKQYTVKMLFLRHLSNIFEYQSTEEYNEECRRLNICNMEFETEDLIYLL